MVKEAEAHADAVLKGNRLNSDVWYKLAKLRANSDKGRALEASVTAAGAAAGAVGKYTALLKQQDKKVELIAVSLHTVAQLSLLQDSAWNLAKELGLNSEEIQKIQSSVGPKPDSSKNPGIAAADTKFTSPPPNWPKASDDIAGQMEVRVKNPNDFQVRVGVRSGDKGKDLVVGANGVESVRVPNGRYDIYFQYSTDSEGLYQGDSFTLKDNGVQITITKVVNGNYGIRKVK